MTLSEIVVVVAILGLLILLTVFSFKPTLQLARARDSRRKADLKKISVAVEDYSGDHPCSPVKVYENSETCRPATEFAAYLNPVPCDPQTKKPYSYKRLDPNCKQYAVYATLELEKIITYGAEIGNYVVSNVRLEPTSLTPGAGGGETTPGPTAPAGIYYGCFSGVCLKLSGSEQCDPNYIGSDNCFGKCGTPENPLNECD